MVVGGEDIDVPRRQWDVDVRIVGRGFCSGQMVVSQFFMFAIRVV